MQTIPLTNYPIEIPRGKSLLLHCRDYAVSPDRHKANRNRKAKDILANEIILNDRKKYHRDSKLTVQEQCYIATIR